MFFHDNCSGSMLVSQRVNQLWEVEDFSHQHDGEQNESGTQRSENEVCWCIGVWICRLCETKGIVD